MTGRFAALILAALVLGVASLRVGALTELTCGSLAPFKASCSDGPAEAATTDPVLSHHLLGFLGQLDIVLSQSGGPAAAKACVQLAAGFFSCSPQVGRLVIGEPVTLECTARPYMGLGPSGPWGCQASV